MDPVAHTLFGATMAETGLRRLTRYATPTLIIGANLPDIDAVVTVLGRDTSLLLRRGWTHGVLALVLLPLLWTAGVWAWHRWRARPDEEGPPLRLGWVLALSCLGIWSHPTLDWMNTYGVRLLMPFDGRWFYGDTLFIVDPWFWLLTAAGVVLARSSTRRAVIGWCVLGGLASALVLGMPTVAVGVKVGWALGVGAILALRWRARAEVMPRWTARVGAATLILYLGVAFGLARMAEDAAAGAGEEAPLEVQANPIPGVPFEHRVVMVYADRYRVIPPHGEPFEVPRREPDEVVQAALAAPWVQGFVHWTRYPYWIVRHEAGGTMVELRDLRYVDPGQVPRGIGYAQVWFDRDLKPHPEAPLD